MKKMTMIKALQEDGMKVFLRHSEREDGGHVTKAAVYDEKNNKLYYASALCHPGDQFSRKKGRAIALGRAICERTRTEVDTTDWTEERLQECLSQVVYS